MEPYAKPDVFDASQYYNTVGQELCDILEMHEKSRIELEKILAIKDLSAIKKFKAKEADAIVRHVGIDDLREYFLRFQENYKEAIKLCGDEFKKAQKEIRQFKEVKILLDRDYGNDDFYGDILDYFNEDSISIITSNASSIQAQFRQKDDVKVDMINLQGWLRRGRIEFDKSSPLKYDNDGLEKWIAESDWRRNVESVKYFMSLPEKLSKFGLTLVLLPFLPKTVFGAVQWIDGQPLVILSDRTQDLASCWFTLFHELGHVLLHENTDIVDRDINEKALGKTKAAKKEQEANQYASQLLYKGDVLRNYIYGLKNRDGYESANIIANKLGVNSVFVKHWLRKAQIRPSQNQKIDVKFTVKYL